MGEWEFGQNGTRQKKKIKTGNGDVGRDIRAIKGPTKVLKRRVVERYTSRFAGM